ncbi:MAG: hypothetical protein CMM86_13460 [Rhodovulum sp.]|nr:hypothetical protein [Rhodovulum sp.]
MHNLTTVLLAFKLTLCGHDGLDEYAFGRIVEFEVQALNQRPAFRKFSAELDMKLGVAGKALKVIKNDDIGLASLCIEIG